MSKSVTVNLRLPSETPDITCADGEVARFENVDWLRISADDTSATTFATQLSILSQSLPVTFPYGSRLLAIHIADTPHASDPQRRYLCLTPDYSLVVVDSSGNIRILIRDTYSELGEIKVAKVFGDYILIISDKRLLQIVFDPDSDSYIIPEAHPGAPDVSFSLKPSLMPDYVNRIGDFPMLQLAVELPAAEEVSGAMLANWLDKGVASSVTISVQNAVFKAVGIAVDNFISEVRRRGLFLSSVKCLSAFDSLLPSSPVVVAAPDAESSLHAKLFTWAYHAGVLHLQIYLSLRPLSLSADFNLPDSQSVWIRRFHNLNIYVSSELPVVSASASKLVASAYTPILNPSSGQTDGFAFRFPGLSASEKISFLNSVSDFRLALSRSPESAAAAPLNIARPSASLPVFSPDYSDFNIPAPENCIVSDQGFILFGGSASIRDSYLSSRSVSLRGSILSSIPGYPFIFRHLTQVSDGEIMAVAQSSGARQSAPSGRHPLQILSSDGIRLLAADGSGGYLNSKLISRLCVVSPLTAQYADKLYFFSPAGLHSLSLSSAVKNILDYRNPDSGSDVDTPLLRPDDWDQMEILGNEEVILLRAPGSTSLINLKTSDFIPLPNISIRPSVAFEGNLYSVSPQGNLLKISLQRINRLQAGGNDDPSGDAESQDSSGDSASILTRPLKFGSAFNCKRLKSVEAARQDIFMIVEGSQNLTDWIEIARGCGRIAPLHLPPFRYFRLYARVDSDLSRNLASFSFSF